MTTNEIIVFLLGVIQMLMAAFGAAMWRKADGAHKALADLRTHVAETYQTKADSNQAIDRVSTEIQGLRQEMRDEIRDMTRTVVQAITSKQ